MVVTTRGKPGPAAGQGADTPAPSTSHAAPPLMAQPQHPPTEAGLPPSLQDIHNNITEDIQNISEEGKTIVVGEARLAGSVAPRTRLLVSRDANGTVTGFETVFEGRDNRLVLLVEVAAHVSCHFNLARYPFDKQACGVTLHLQNLPEQHARFNPRAGTHACPRNTMVEFVLEDCTLHLQNGSNVVRLNMVLRRRWSYHLWATYVPTALLHLVGYGTLTVRPEDFQSRGMLSLLAMLALVGLYSDTLAALPSCSYLRLLDAWLLFSVAFLAAVIAVHVAANDSRRAASHAILRLGKRVLAALYCSFVAAYCLLLAATR